MREQSEDVGAEEALVKESYIDELALLQEEKIAKRKQEARSAYIDALAHGYLKYRFPDAKEHIDMSRLEPLERLRCARSMQRLLCRDSGASLVGLFGGLFSAVLFICALRELITGKSPS